jgi:itaconyl-CoA hydratase
MTRTGAEGRFYEDFEVGNVYEHPYGRTITDADNVWFTNLTMNTNPLHFDYHYASKTEFGKPLVNSAFTLALVTGQSVIDISENAFANLGWDKVTLPAPVFVGDTLYAETEVLDKRESRSRPNVGILKFKTRGYKQDGTVVIEFERTILIYKRGQSPRRERPRPKAVR